MITEAFAKQKHFILAKVYTRGISEDNSSAEENSDYNNYTRKSIKRPIENEQNESSDSTQIAITDGYYYFNVYNILSNLFKRRDNDFIGRYHPDCNFSIKIPGIQNERVM